MSVESRGLRYVGPMLPTRCDPIHAYAGTSIVPSLFILLGAHTFRM